MRKKGKITISDVASEMRVSVTTVSWVLNGKAEGRVSPSVIRRITAYANKIGYRPNASKSNKRANKVYCALVEDISCPWQSDLVYYLQEELSEVGGHLAVVSMNGQSKRGSTLLSLCKQLMPLGYFVMPFEELESGSDKEVMRQLVVLDSERASGTTIRLDYAALLTSTLEGYSQRGSLGRVGLITCSSSPVRSNGFIKGYMETMERIDGDVLVKKLQYNDDAVYTNSQIEAFIRDNRLDTIVFSTDRLTRIAGPLLIAPHAIVKRVVSTTNITVSNNAVEQILIPMDASALAKEIAAQFTL